MSPAFNTPDLIRYENPIFPPTSSPDPGIIGSDPPDIQGTIVNSMTVQTPFGPLQ